MILPIYSVSEISLQNSILIFPREESFSLIGGTFPKKPHTSGPFPDPKRCSVVVRHVPRSLEPPLFVGEHGHPQVQKRKMKCRYCKFDEGHLGVEPVFCSNGLEERAKNDPLPVTETREFYTTHKILEDEISEREADTSDSDDYDVDNSCPSKQPESCLDPPGAQRVLQQAKSLNNLLLEQCSNLSTCLIYFSFHLRMQGSFSGNGGLHNDLEIEGEDIKFADEAEFLVGGFGEEKGFKSYSGGQTMPAMAESAMTEMEIDGLLMEGHRYRTHIIPSKQPQISIGFNRLLVVWHRLMSPKPLCIKTEVSHLQQLPARKTYVTRSGIPLKSKNRGCPCEPESKSQFPFICFLHPSSSLFPSDQ
ncbi:hypothetical protein CEXT_29261 [Caerostris extrusa]|uniref:Uncharacterized protein n=1 Tax=Caerostris extrusa TaxID=172846 RepID=A0AAV4QBW0_CAEEX|nr:hypothetical protein CEXT_29261 [Caerostris extrusa]